MTARSSRRSRSTAASRRDGRLPRNAAPLQLQITHVGGRGDGSVGVISPSVTLRPASDAVSCKLTVSSSMSSASAPVATSPHRPRPDAGTSGEMGLSSGKATNLLRGTFMRAVLGGHACVRCGGGCFAHSRRHRRSWTLSC